MKKFSRTQGVVALLAIATLPLYAATDAQATDGPKRPGHKVGHKAHTKPAARRHRHHHKHHKHRHAHRHHKHASATRAGVSAGVPAGMKLRPSGSVTVSTPGAVVNGLDINGTLTIAAPNVTVKNTRISASAFWVVTIKDNATGARFDHVTVDGHGMQGAEGTSGVVGPGTFAAVDVSGVENGFVPGTGSTITDSYVHGLSAPGAPHYDGIQIDGGVRNITVSGNTIVNNQGQTSAVMVDNYFGAATGIVVTNNHLVGGDYTVYADASFNNNPVSVTYAHNRMGKGVYGYSLLRGADVTWSGNTDDRSAARLAR